MLLLCCEPIERIQSTKWLIPTAIPAFTINIKLGIQWDNTNQSFIQWSDYKARLLCKLLPNFTNWIIIGFYHCSVEAGREGAVLVSGTLADNWSWIWWRRQRRLTVTLSEAGAPLSVWWREQNSRINTSHTQISRLLTILDVTSPLYSYSPG